MRQVLKIVLAVVMVAGAGALAGAQTPADVMKIEVLVATTLLATADGAPTHNLVLEPGFAENGHAPGGASILGGRRSDARNAAIAQAIHAIRIADFKDARPCRDCGPAGVGSVLTFSDPVFSGDSATMTGTVRYALRNQMMSYETIQFVLEKKGGQWAIRRTKQLGIS